MIVNCPTCGNSGDWCQSCDGIGSIPDRTAEAQAAASIRALEDKHAHMFPAHEMLDLSKYEQKYAPCSAATDMQPKPGKTAPGPVPTRRKK